jgi:bacitracin transport system permease protein
MINILYSELLKLKKSYFLLIILAGGLALPLLLFSGWLVQGQTVAWERYTSNSEIMMFIMLCPILFSLVSAYVFSREFTDKTANILYSYPVHKIEIFIGKLLVIFMVIAIIYIIHFAALFGGGLLLKHEPLTKEILLAHGKVHLYSMIFHFALIPIGVFIASLCRNIILPIVCGTLVSLTNMFLLSGNKFKYSPFMMPFMPLGNYMKKLKYFVDTQTILMAVAVFVVGFIACSVYYLKTDID